MTSILNSALLATPVEHLKSKSFRSLRLLTRLSLVLVKLQMQVQRSVHDRQYKGPVDCARQVIAAKGIMGLWTGFTGCLAFRANFFWLFGSFEVFMRAFKSERLEGTVFEVYHFQRDFNIESNVYLSYFGNLDEYGDGEFPGRRLLLVRIVVYGHTGGQY